MPGSQQHTGHKRGSNNRCSMKSDSGNIMQVLTTLKKRTLESMVVITVGCAVLLICFALKESAPLSPTTQSSVLLIVVLCQTVLYSKFLHLRRREKRFHQVGRKLVQLRAQRSKEESRALEILNHINSTNDKIPDHAHVWQKPLQSFSGDLALAYKSKCGSNYTLLADLTGHGITAAISAAPVASIFKATARNGLCVEEIIAELNNRLQELLPSGFFCCAAIILDNNGVVTACNAGLPDLLITNNNGEVVHSIASTQLPLGIERITTNEVEVFTNEYKHRHQLYAFTDGLIETTGANDEVFDIDTLTSLVSVKNDGNGRLGEITDSFESFSKDSALYDDISIVEVIIR